MIYNTYFQIDTKQYPYLYTHTLGVQKSIIFHHHEFYEFVYIQEGKAINIIGDNEYALKKGDFSLIVPGESHKLVAERGCTYRDICIPPKFFEELCSFLHSEQCLAYITGTETAKKFSCSAQLTLLLEQKLNYLSSKPDKSDLEAKLLASSFVNELLLELIPKDNAFFSKDMPEWLHTIILRFQQIEYVSKGISEIIKDINYNEIYINRMFKQYTGKSLRAYLSETKLELSLTYLKFSTHSVNEISDILGFSSLSFFYKQFKNKYNLTPSEYREQFFSNDQRLISNQQDIDATSYATEKAVGGGDSVLP